jgi:hypothetical protein
MMKYARYTVSYVEEGVKMSIFKKRSKKIFLSGVLLAFMLSFALGASVAYATAVHVSANSDQRPWTASNGYTYTNLATVDGYNAQTSPDSYYARSTTRIAPTSNSAGYEWLWVKSYLYRGNNALYGVGPWFGNANTVNVNTWHGHSLLAPNPNSGGLGWYSWDSTQVWNGSTWDPVKDTWISPTIYYP